MLKNLFSLLILVCISTCYISCSKKNKDTDAPSAPAPGVVRPHGTTVGNAAKVIIGPGGGNLTSGDGLLQLTVPAGALAADTEISMQEVTNTLPGSPTASYRLLPENVQFTKPVQLKFRYHAHHLDSTAAEAMHLAFQSADGIWRFIPHTALNETDSTLIAETTHFSDWTVYTGIYLTVSNKDVRVGKSAHLVIHTDENYQADWLLAPLTTTTIEAGLQKVIENSANISNWKLSGAGKLAPSGREATYSAPATMPANNKAQVSVEVRSFIPAGVIPGRGATGKMILFANLNIVDETYLTGTLNGVDINCTGVGYTQQDGAIILGGTYAPNTVIAVYLRGTGFGVGSRAWRWTLHNDGLDASIEHGVAGSRPLGTSFYPVCDESGITVDYVSSGGGFTVTKVERVGQVEYVTGTMTGTMWHHGFSDCNGIGAAQPFSFSFRAKGF